MPRPLRRAAAIAASAVLLLGLAACAAPAPEPEPTDDAASASPEPTPVETQGEPVLQDVVIDGSGVAVRLSDGTEVVDVPFQTTPAEAVRLLGDALDESATTETVTDDACYPILEVSSFGGLHLSWSTEGLRKPAGAQFYATADEAETAGGIPIVISSGQSVGDDAESVLGANLDSPSFDNGDWIDLHYDVESGDASSEPGEYYGAYAQIEDDELVLVSSPTFYFFDC